MKVTPMSRAAYERLVELREKGLSQSEIAAVLGVSQTAVHYRLKRGWRDASSNRRMTEAQRRRAVQLLEGGASYAEVAGAIGFAPASVYAAFSHLRRGR